MTHYRTATIDGHKVFYREAGDPKAPSLLLLHGFPTSSHMFRDLIPLLADRYHVVAPDLLGFGFSDAPDRAQFKYTFDNLTKIVAAFTEAIGLKQYAIYVFDYGAPIGFRLALAHPERVTAIISQNGNAYEEGLSQGWNPIQKYWNEPTDANRAALREFLKPEATKSQYLHGGRARHKWRPNPTRSILRCWRGAAMTRFNLTCFWITRATSRSTRNFRNISAPSGRPCSLSGARTIRSSCRRAPRHSGATT